MRPRQHGRRREDDKGNDAEDCGPPPTMPPRADEPPKQQDRNYHAGDGQRLIGVLDNTDDLLGNRSRRQFDHRLADREHRRLPQIQDCGQTLTDRDRRGGGQDASRNT